MSAYLSYAKFLEDRLNFKKSGSRNGESFNIFDTPSHKFFKIMFYFGSKNDDETDNNFSSGLLAPTWDIINTKSDNVPYYNYNSAWAYLKMNDENERAEKLERFVTLLSNINSYSPWYFTAISGIDTALERKSVEEGKLDLSETKKLTITCMPDAFDNRIGTLLELYRDIVWSWVQKKEIVPSNLRKFDMAVYIFESPIGLWHDFENDKLDNNNKEKYLPSYKMLEFHDCEFSYNSIKSGWNEFSNETGVSPKYTIEISYNDCYEESYNELLMRKIGDVITTDTYRAIMDENGLNISRKPFESYAQTDSVIQSNEIEKRMEKPSSFLENAVGQVVGTAKSYLERKFERAVLGNLHTYSLTQLASQADSAIRGDIIKTGQSIKQYVKNAQERAAAKVNKNKNLGNIFKNTIANN